MTSVDAWIQGKVILHWADTIPGLSFNPWHDAAWSRLRACKGRDKNMPCLGLVTSLDMAQQWWKPLSEAARRTLKTLWPGQVTVLYQASAAVPESMRSEQGEVGLRLPATWNQPNLASWIDQIGHPIPSTSVNVSGEPPCRDLASAIDFALLYPQIYVAPDLFALAAEIRPRGCASRIVRLDSSGATEQVRPASSV